MSVFFFRNFNRKQKGCDFMKESFGILPNGVQAFLYTISCGKITAAVTNYGAALVRLEAPDRHGNPADVILGFGDVNGYREEDGCLGATVGRSANRLKGASFRLNGREYRLTPNEGANNLHSGPEAWYRRLWETVEETERSVTFLLRSPDGDQGYPGNAAVKVTYELDELQGLHIRYEGICDQDTVFNLTNHSYFNLSGHENTEKAMDQLLTMPSQFFNPDDAQNIPTGEILPVEDTPMDFRRPKALKRDLALPYGPLILQGGYDHNFLAADNPCAVLTDPQSGRTMTVYTDCPGIQLYTGNFLDARGKDGVYYGRRSGVALETQFAPDSLHHPDWPQPVTPANTPYRSETIFRFTAI